MLPPSAVIKNECGLLSLSRCRLSSNQQFVRTDLFVFSSPPLLLVFVLFLCQHIQIIFADFDCRPDCNLMSDVVD